MDSRLFCNASSKIKWVHGILRQGVEVYGDRGQRHKAGLQSHHRPQPCWLFASVCVCDSLHVKSSSKKRSTRGVQLHDHQLFPISDETVGKQPLVHGGTDFLQFNSCLLTRYMGTTSRFLYRMFESYWAGSTNTCIRFNHFPQATCLELPWPWYLWVYFDTCVVGRVTLLKQ